MLALLCNRISDCNLNNNDSSLISSTYAKDVLTLLSQSLVCLNIAVFISF